MGVNKTLRKGKKPNKLEIASESGREKRCCLLLQE